MLRKRVSWFSGSVLSGGVAMYLTWLGVADKLPPWSLYAVGGVALVASISQFPVKGEDGSPRPFVSALVRGRGNVNMVAGDQSPVSRNIIGTGRSTQHITFSGSELTYSDVRQIASDVGQVEVLPAVREVASQAVVVEIESRIGWMTDKVVDRLNEQDPKPFDSFESPRFLAALTSAQRGYAETGDDELGEMLAGMVSGLATEPIRSRKEILLRQGIDVAQRLTTEHVNALATIMYITYMTLDPRFTTEGLISAYDGLLKPFYGRVPTGEIDYQYMSSVGVCHPIPLRRDVPGGIYGVLHSHNINTMYPLFTSAEMEADVFSDSGLDGQDIQKLFIPLTVNPEGVRYTPDGQSQVRIEDARFRLHPDLAKVVLSESNSRTGEPLTEWQARLRGLVQQRMLTPTQLEERIRAEKPQLAEFLDNAYRTGCFHYLLHPVGFIVAKYAIESHAPHMAQAVDDALAGTT